MSMIICVLSNRVNRQLSSFSSQSPDDYMVRRTGCSSAIVSLWPALLPSRERRTGDPPANARLQPRRTGTGGHTTSPARASSLSPLFPSPCSLFRNPVLFCQHSQLRITGCCENAPVFSWIKKGHLSCSKLGVCFLYGRK